jgi:hypothetical protein
MPALQMSTLKASYFWHWRNMGRDVDECAAQRRAEGAQRRPFAQPEVCQFCRAVGGDQDVVQRHIPMRIILRVHVLDRPRDLAEVDLGLGLAEPVRRPHDVLERPTGAQLHEQENVFAIVQDVEQPDDARVANLRVRPHLVREILECPPILADRRQAHQLARIRNAREAVNAIPDLAKGALPDRLQEAGRTDECFPL